MMTTQALQSAWLPSATSSQVCHRQAKRALQSHSMVFCASLQVHSPV